jgi:hypothetical protein
VSQGLVDTFPQAVYAVLLGAVDQHRQINAVDLQVYGIFPDFQNLYRIVKVFGL